MGHRARSGIVTGDSAKLQEVTIGEVGEVFGEDASVPVLLQRRQLHTYNLLLLGWQLLQHILLQPPQQVRGQQLMQLCYLHANAQAPSLKRLSQGGCRRHPMLVLAIQLPYDEQKRLHIALTGDGIAFAKLLLPKHDHTDERTPSSSKALEVVSSDFVSKAYLIPMAEV
jgi:hypothetical protein